MPRRFYFRNNADMSFGSILQQINKFLAAIISIAYSLCIRVIATVITWVEALAFVSGMPATATHSSQFLQTGNLQTPGFIITKMEMQDIQFIRCKNIHQFLQVLRSGEITGNIYHLSTICQVRIIPDGDCLQQIRCLLVLQH